jgi:hypothetical protein
MALAGMVWATTHLFHCLFSPFIGQYFMETKVSNFSCKNKKKVCFHLPIVWETDTMAALLTPIFFNRKTWTGLHSILNTPNGIPKTFRWFKSDTRHWPRHFQPISQI